MSYTVLNVSCIDQQLSIANAPVVASGGVNEDFIQFTFCEKWDGFAKTAVFWREENNPYSVVLDENDGALIPHEVLLTDGKLYFGVFGTSGTTTRTSTIVGYNIKRGAVVGSASIPDPTQSVYEQILAQLAAVQVTIRDTMEELQSGLEQLDNVAAKDHTHSLATDTTAGFMSPDHSKFISGTKARVIETDYVGTWTYRKWDDGTAECWGDISRTMMFSEVMENQGNTAVTAIFVEDFPPNLFTNVPRCWYAPYPHATGGEKPYLITEALDQCTNTATPSFGLERSVPLPVERA